MIRNFLKRALLPALVAALVGVAAVALVRGTSRLASPGFSFFQTTVTGQVSAYLLDPRGEVEGLLLSSGDQLRFGPATGAAVAAAVKIGDEVTATGRAGTRSDYGRELRVKTLTAAGQTFTVTGPAGPPHEGPRGPHGHGDRRGPHGPGEPGEPGERDERAGPTAGAGEPITASGPVVAHLVNHDGEVDGLVLGGGEQVRFGPETGALVVDAEGRGAASVGVEGTGVRTERGTAIRATRIQVGDQTVTAEGR